MNEARGWWLAALVLMLAAGAADRTLRYRRHVSPAQERARAQIARIPESMGSWAAESATVDEAILKRPVAQNGRILQFRDGRTGSSVLVAILAGPPGLMTDQLPEASFTQVGYALDRSSVRRHVLETRLGIAVPGTLAIMDFWNRDGRTPLRVWQGWYDGTRWSRPEWPQWQFLDHSVIYRLQVWSAATQDPFGPTPEARVDPCRDFLIQALPTITRVLSEG